AAHSEPESFHARRLDRELLSRQPPGHQLVGFGPPRLVCRHLLFLAETGNLPGRPVGSGGLSFCCGPRQGRIKTIPNLRSQGLLGLAGRCLPRNHLIEWRTPPFSDGKRRDEPESLWTCLLYFAAPRSLCVRNRSSSILPRGNRRHAPTRGTVLGRTRCTCGPSARICRSKGGLFRILAPKSHSRQGGDDSRAGHQLRTACRRGARWRCALSGGGERLPPATGEGRSLYATLCVDSCGWQSPGSRPQPGFSADVNGCGRRHSRLHFTRP